MLGKVAIKLMCVFSFSEPVKEHTKHQQQQIKCLEKMYLACH